MEECTRDEIGVGAAIASGSQAEKGIWALLVKAAKMNIIIIRVEKEEGVKINKL